MWKSTVLAVLLAFGACSSAHGGGAPAPATATTDVPATEAPAPTTATSTSTSTSASTADSTEEYRPGRQANLFLPSRVSEAPLVVMVPGGAWRTADPAGFADLAAFLAAEGSVALTVEVGAAEDGVAYPEPLADIRCAVTYAADRAREAGIEPGPVVLVGHSSGAHLASLVALDDDSGPRHCEPTKVDGLVGLAGVYDVDRIPVLAYLLFGVTPEEDPVTWQDGNPLHRADLRPELPVLLGHGDSDPIVPLSFSEDFAAALEDGGHDVTIRIAAGSDHREIISPGVVGETIREWITGLP